MPLRRRRRRCDASTTTPFRQRRPIRTGLGYVLSRWQERNCVHGVAFDCIPVLHGKQSIVGFRFGRAAYLTDVSDIPESSFALLEGLDCVVLSALRHKPHPSHATLGQAVEWAQRIGARQTWFTHIAHDLGHAETNRSLPKGMALAYDGLSVPVTSMTERSQPHDSCVQVAGRAACGCRLDDRCSRQLRRSASGPSRDSFVGRPGGAGDGSASSGDHLRSASRAVPASRGCAKASDAHFESGWTCWLRRASMRCWCCRSMQHWRRCARGNLCSGCWSIRLHVCRDARGRKLSLRTSRGRRREGAQGLRRGVWIRRSICIARCACMGSRYRVRRYARLVAAGDMKRARWMLGRPFRVRSTQARGRGVGTRLLVPTVNLAQYDELLPAFGVYVTRLTIGDRCFQAVTNVGNRPTFEGVGFGVETHILNFEPVEMDENTPLRTGVPDAPCGRRWSGLRRRR